ncbi:MAG: M16 family metallopeptidase [Roseiarcus sp.]
MSVEITTLPSGLRVVTDAMPHLKTASLGVFVGAGSRHELTHEHGLSHLLEHMAFKGTRRRSARDIAEAIENAGGDLNAETGVEQTAYLARVLGEDAELALDILADILTDSAFDAAELEREKGVILQEIGAVEDAPDDLVFDRFTSAAWPGQPIGRPILGTPERVGAVNRTAIHGYLRSHYLAGAMIVAGAGALEHAEIVELSAKRFEPLGRREAPIALPATYRGGETMTKKPLGQTHIIVGFEGRAVHAPDHDAAHVFAAAAGGGMSSRLFQEVREKRGLAYSIYSFHWAYSDVGLMGVYAATSPRDSGELMDAALDCLSEAAASLTEEEVQRAKAQMKVSLLTALESSGARTQQIARQMLIYGRPLGVEEMIARIERLNVRDVREAGAAMLRSTPTIAAVGRTGKVMDQARVARRLAGN